MSRKEYWALNAAWQVLMYVALHVFYKYESHYFDYQHHNFAHHLWVVGSIAALVSSLVFYVILEVAKQFLKK